MLVFLFYLNLKIKVDTIVSHIYFDSNYHAKCKIPSTFIQLVTITNLFAFEIVQKCQPCKLDVLRESSNGVVWTMI